MKTPVVFTIGGATFDIFVRPADQGVMRFTKPGLQEQWLCLPYGGKIRAEQVLETFGGGATNTAVAFARMGFQASFVGAVGREYGDKVIANLEREHVNTKFVHVTDRDKTAFSIILNTFDGDRTVLGYAGANDCFKSSHVPWAELARADWIFFNHLTDQKSGISKDLLRFLQKNPRIRLAWNPGHEQIAGGIAHWQGLLKRTDILFMNKEEASLFARMPYKPAGIKKDDPKYHAFMCGSFLPPYADDVSGIMARFLKAGVKTVVITDGRNGSQATDGKRIYFCPIVTHKRVDTLGAGDAFGSGFTSARILGEDLKASLIYGTLNANSVVGQFGAQAGLLPFRQIQSLRKKTSLTVSSTRFLTD